MKERPILFSAPMVRAILEGRKTMTRRVVKNSINELHIRGNPVQLLADWALSGLRSFEGNVAEFEIQCDVDDTYYEQTKCPYGTPGDRLWVRETWQKNTMQTGFPYYYRATDEDFVSGPWRPSIFMPRAASRILLEIESVRVERLLGITNEDAIAEGVERWPDENWKSYGKHTGKYTHPRDSFLSLWQSINGPNSWEQNPWVWVIEFKRV